jgi:DedD protein
MAEGRGERTIGSGQLVALFLGIVVLCCIFFILGYEMARAQFEKGGAAVAAKPVAPSPAPATGTEPSPAGWPSATSTGSAAPAKGGTSTTPAKAAPPPGKASATAAHGSQASPSDLLKPPDLSKGGIVLQVLASKSESDSLNLAKILQEKGFPAFVLTPSSSTDNWYRVQVGPFPDAKAAEQAKAALAQEGFKAFVKR